MNRSLLSLFLVFNVLVFVPAMASTLSLHSEYAIVVDNATGAILYEKSSTASAPIASVTKLMTAMVLVDQKLDPNEVLTVTEADVDTARLERGEEDFGAGRRGLGWAFGSLPLERPDQSE